MNFDKQYIELCENDKVQRLRPKFVYGDWIIHENFKEPLVFKEKDMPTYAHNKIRDVYYWLPTSEQLDEEVVKICNEKAIDYSFKYIFSNQQYECSATSVPAISHSNPFIAKIKLLISLLEG